MGTVQDSLLEVPLQDGPKEACSWDALPEDVLAMILGRLSVVRLAQLRSVCKTWNRIVTGVAVGPQHAQPWMFVCRKLMWEWEVYSMRGFDPVSCRWFNFPLPPILMSQLKLCGSLGGYSGLLLLHERWESSDYSGRRPRSGNRHTWRYRYWVGSPWLRRWEQVAPAPELCVDSEGPLYLHQLMVDETTKGFKILCFQFELGIEPERCTAHVYDSCEKRWRTGAITWQAPAGDRLIQHTGKHISSRDKDATVAVSKDTVYFPFKTASGHIRIVGYLVEENRFEVVFSGIPEPGGGERATWVLLDERGQRPAPALLQHGSLQLHVITFSQDQHLDRWDAECRFVCMPRFPSQFSWILKAAGNLKRLYVAATPDAPLGHPLPERPAGPAPSDEFWMYDSSGWTQVPPDLSFGSSFGRGDFCIETSVPRFDVAVGASKAVGPYRREVAGPADKTPSRTTFPFF